MEKKEANSESNSLITTAVAGLRRYIDRIHGGNVAAAKREFSMTGNTLDSWLNGTRRPSLAKIGPILERLRAEITFPDENANQPKESNAEQFLLGKIEKLTIERDALLTTNAALTENVKLLKEIRKIEQDQPKNELNNNNEIYAHQGLQTKVNGSSGEN